MRGIPWSWDPDPADDLIQMEFALVLRDGLRVESVHDTHVEGLFSRATWHALIAETGFVTAEFARPLGGGACRP
ncbi:hypothetical protein OV203_40620 [Nannocystis sp. ILAH1]|uniref:hypothetical protein n=1 Tax=unclassified Nannocystis TaxID=2627009 RepID=UPI00226FBBC7|nr:MULTISPECIES: hypothetical protein [unclassified Nannocystis]MCY0993512.1 hypothetical protein [Nannocystis sp. ILAH1]MCY1063760.1 hypothetical protein [Nannocystis sp. RBIL2]